METHRSGQVVGLFRDAAHRFSKPATERITLLAGIGVEGDAHAGVTVKHRSRVARDPSLPNLRQVHLLQAELLAELAAKGFRVKGGDLGENITTAGLDILALPTGTLLRIGPAAVVEVTGLRNPCRQLDRFHCGLMQATLERSREGHLIRKAGVMAVVREGGNVCVGDAVSVALPQGPFRALQPV